MSKYEILPEFVQDSPEWHEARRRTLGASEVAAVLGLSPWQTPLSVWRTKMGVPNEIPEDLAFFGHALETPIANWISKKHPEVGLISDGISVRSLDHQWLSATPDRIAYVPLDGDAPPFDYIPVELKTSSAFSRNAWAEGVPDYYKVQSIVQQGILGTDFGWLAVLHGGNSPELYRIPFDPTVWEQIIRITGEWWETHVMGEVAPDPSTSAEAMDLWPGNPELTVEGNEQLFELWEAYGLMQAEQVDVGERLDAVKLELQKAMKDATALTYQGRELFTWKPRKGAVRWDTKALESDLPELAAKYKREGAPTRTFLRKTTKEVAR